MWKFVFVLVAVTFSLSSCGDLDEERVDEDARAMDTEKWRAVENHPQDSIDWVPADGLIPASEQSSNQSPERIVKRRRVRKRKRRPQNFDQEYQEDVQFPDRPLRPRLRRPQRPENLDQQQDQWRDEMMSEEPFRPIRGYKRRRLYPKYEESQGNEDNEETMVAGTQIRVADDNENQRIIPEEEFRTPGLSDKNRDSFGDDNKRVQFPRRKLRDPAVRTEEIPEEPLQDKEPVISTTHAPIDLKAILKQAGGISLSELLQQKNLSLSDLLKGEQHAISALTKMQSQINETDPPTDNSERVVSEVEKPKRYNGYRRIPPSVNKKNADNSEYVKEIIEPERRTTYPPVRKENKHFTDFKIYEFTTEATTERRIFVPSHPKYYTSVNFKPDMRDLNIQKTTTGYTSTSTVTESVNDDENSLETTAVPTTTTKRTVRTEQPKSTRKNTLPPTLAKLRNLYARTTVKPIIREAETENYPRIPFVPEKAIKIDINELFGISNVLTPKTTEGPLKISVNIQQIEDNSREMVNKENSMSTTDNKFVVFEEISTTEQISEPEKLKPTSAKQEIQELLSDEMSRDNLLHILEARNMTLTELLEQRERGSSQRHLADIFHNQTREPEPQEVIVDHILKHKVAENPFLDRLSIEPRPSLTINKEVKYPDIKPDFLQPLDEPTNSREARQNQFLRKQTEDYNILNNPLFRTDTKKTNEVINKLIPVWRQAYTNMQKPNPQSDAADSFMNEDLLLKDEAQRVEEIENQIAEAVNGALNEVDTVSHKISEEEESYLQLPYGVRSAVIASATIVGISLFVFVTIFIIFKWSQKKHKRLSYSNSLSSLKIRSPILETQYQKRIFGQIMDSTLGRNKKISTISTSEPQSLQDYLWENDRKPFQ